MPWIGEGDIHNTDYRLTLGVKHVKRSAALHLLRTVHEISHDLE